MAISNRYKDMLNNLIDSSDDSLDIELLAISKQIIMLNNNISGLGDNINSLEKDGDFLSDRS